MLDVPIQTLWDTTIIYIITGNFHDQILRDWESVEFSGESHTLENLKSFLKEK